MPPDTDHVRFEALFTKPGITNDVWGKSTIYVEHKSDYSSNNAFFLVQKEMLLQHMCGLFHSSSDIVGSEALRSLPCWNQGVSLTEGHLQFMDTGQGEMGMGSIQSL